MAVVPLWNHTRATGVSGSTGDQDAGASRSSPSYLAAIA
jgi:hypothetical protein